MTLHHEILTEEQLSVLVPLARVARDGGFYLAGGTAIALYLGHRRSIDFDWFTSDAYDDPHRMIRLLSAEGLNLTSAQVSRGTLLGTVNNVKVSFFRYDYPLLAELTHWEEYGIDIASLDDIAAMKLAAIAQRGSRKDFVDIYALATKHKPISEMLALYCSKYSMPDAMQVIYGLAYFDDAEKQPMPQMLWKVSWKHIKDEILSWVRGGLL